MRDDEADLNPNYFVKFIPEDPPTASKIGKISIHTDNIGEFTIGSDSHGNMVENSLHPLVLKATHSTGAISNLPINVQLKAPITEPSSPVSTIYGHVGGPMPNVELDYSLNMIEEDRITFMLLEDNNKPLPENLFNLETNATSYLTIKSQRDLTTEDIGIYKLRVKATLDLNSVQSVHFTLFILSS